MEDSQEDIFCDTISQGSVRNKRDYINLSRYTIYHSAEDLHDKMAEEEAIIDRAIHNANQSSASSPKSPMVQNLINYLA